MAESKAKLGIDLEVKTAKASRNVKKFSGKGRKSFKAMEDSAKKFSLAFKGAIALFAGQKVLGAFNSVIDAAKKQEDAINALNTQLKLSGDFTAEASKDFQNFASSLQQVSTVGDETTLEMLALAKSFGTTNDGAKKLTLAALELSKVNGKDARTNIEQLAKTYSGAGGRLRDLVPGMRDLTKEQLQNGAAIDLIIDKYGGGLTSSLQTFSGVTTALSNSWGDLLENLGFSITQSPALINSLGGITGAIQKIGEFLADNKIDVGSILGAGIDAAVAIAVKSAQVISRAFRFVSTNALQLGKVVLKVAEWFLSFESVNTIAATAMGALAEVIGRVLQGLNLVIKGWAELGKIMGFDVAIVDDLTAGIDNFSQSLIDVEPEELGKDLSEGLGIAIKSVDDFQAGIISADEKFQDLGDTINDAMAKGSASINKTSKDLAKGLDGPQTKVQSEKESLSGTLSTIGDEGVKLGQSVFTGLSSAISSNAGKLGENAAKAAEEASKNVFDGVAEEVKLIEDQIKELKDAENGDIVNAKEIAELEASIKEKNAKAVIDAQKAADKASNQAKIETGKEAGVQFATAAGAALATAVAGPIGGELFNIVSSLSMMSDEDIELFIDSLVEGAIALAEGIADKADVIIEALVNSLIVKGGIFRIAGALIQGLINASGALVRVLANGIGAAFSAFLSGVSKVFNNLLNGLIELPKKIFDAISDALSFDFGGGGFGLGGDKGLLGGAIIPGLLNEGGIAGFNAGGILQANNGVMVPGAGNSDSQLALLTPGEVVIPKPNVNNFAGVVGEIAKEAVGVVSSGGERIINVMLHINDEIIAEQLVRISNDNLRTA